MSNIVSELDMGRDFDISGLVLKQGNARHRAVFTLIGIRVSKAPPRDGPISPSQAKADNEMSKAGMVVNLLHDSVS